MQYNNGNITVMPMLQMEINGCLVWTLLTFNFRITETWIIMISEQKVNIINFDNQWKDKFGGDSFGEVMGGRTEG